MTGIEEFKNFFGGITILNVLEFGLAVAFLAFLYKKAKKYLIERHEAQVEKDQGLKKALEEVAKYPDYRKQSINVQNQLESEIGELRATIEANTQKLQQMENDQNRRAGSGTSSGKGSFNPTASTQICEETRHRPGTAWRQKRFGRRSEITNLSAETGTSTLWYNLQ